MRFKLIDEAKKEFPVCRLCRVLGASESGYFAWKHRGPSQRQLDDMILLAHIRVQFASSHKTYGSPRMHVELCEDGVQVCRHRVARLMRDNGMRILQKRRYKITTDSDHGGLVAPNLLDQDFDCDGPNQKWGVDISYIWTREGWSYLAITALQRAIATRQPPTGIIHHSDRGSQYCSYDYRKLLATNGILSSMNGKGNC